MIVGGNGVYVFYEDFEFCCVVCDIKDIVRFGGSLGVNLFVKEDNGKLVKLVGDSCYDMCVVGDKIEGIV